MVKLDLNVLAFDSEQDYQVIEFRGEMDKSNNVNVRNALEKFIENFELKKLIFDLTYFDFVNSEGVGLLVSLYYKAFKKNVSLVIVSPQPQVLDVFNIIGLSKIVPVFDELDQALAS